MFMKLQQTGDQIELKSNGIGQLLVGLVFVAAGIGVTVLIATSTSTNGKKAPIWVTAFGLLFVAIGAGVMFMAQNRRVVIQRGGNVTVTGKRLLGGSPQQQSVPVANVLAVRLTTSADYSSAGDGDTTNQRRSVLSLVLNNNDLIEIGSARSHGISINGINVSNLITKAPLSKEANQLATFLNVPIQASDTSTIAGAVQSIKSAFQQPSAGPAPITEFNPNPAPAVQPQPAQPAAPRPSAPQSSISPQNIPQPVIPPQPSGAQSPAPPQSPPPGQNPPQT